MPRGIYTRTEEMNLNRSKQMLGSKLSEETRKKMSGRTPWNKGTRGVMTANKTSFKKGNTAPITAYRKGHTPWNSGIESPYTPWNKGKKLDTQEYPNMGFRGGYYDSPSGDKNHRWKGGISSENQKIRGCIEYRLWVNSVFARDGYTCQKYHTVGYELEAHHILTFAEHPELRFAIDNGITLSKKAHKEFHKIYGRKNNTREQLEEFLNNDNARL